MNITQLSPSDDSWVDFQTPDSNHGNETEIHVKADKQTRRAYLKFDLSVLPVGTTVTSAKLYLYCTVGPSTTVQVDVHETNDSWTENTLTWNNAPTVGALAASNTQVQGVGQYYYWNVTSYAQLQFGGDKILSVVVKFPLDDPYSNNPNVHRDFASKEYNGTSCDPYLEITYTAQQAPVASFTYSPADPCVYDIITFNASASYDPDGYIVSYRWDFGDENITTVTDPIITHIYTVVNSTIIYTVNLTVTDDEGLTNSTTDTVTVTNPSILHVSLPAGTYVGSNPDDWLSQCWLLNITDLSGTFTIRINNTHASWASYDTHLIIALNNASYEYLDSLDVETTTIFKTSFIYGTPEPYGFTLTWEKDVYPTWFSDVYVAGTVNPKSYKDMQVSVTFSNTTGVRMHFDAYGSTDSPPPPTGKGRVTHNPHQKDSTVLFWPPPLIPPVACFTVSNDRPNVCETVTFNATCSYDPDDWIVNYTWNFGDSNITTVTYPIITHHYDTFGNYTATLTVTDNDGLTNSTSKSIWVREHPVARFTYSPSYPQVCEVVVFNASDSTADGGYIVNYTWNFGDSNITTVTDPIITHHYDNYGNYTVTLNVTDSEGKWDTESKNITVTAKPHADFTWSPLYPQVDETVTFNASTSTPNGGTIVSYIWDFGDSNSGSGKIANHTYAAFGNYTVTLNVTDSEGKWDVVSKNITVRAHPHADFTWSPPSPQVCEMVTFNASASTPDGGTIISYEWSFGDGNITIIGDDEPITPIITHHYTAPGDYYVTLTVTDSEGKSDTTEPPIVITVLAMKYYLTVQTDPAGIVTIPGEGWYGNCTYVNLTAPEFVPNATGVRYRFDNWTVNGEVFTTLNITVHMDANHTATAHYVLQYQVTFTHTGLSSDASGTVVTVGGVAKTFSDLPYTTWVDNGTVVTYSYEATVSSTISGKRFSLVSVTGPASPFTVTGPVTVTGNYKTQYEITFDQTGVGSDFTGTVVTIDGTNYGVGALPVSFWWDNCSTHSFDFKSPLTVTPNAKRYVWNSTSGLSSLQSDPITVSTSGSIIGNYKTQYYLTLATSPPGVTTPSGEGWHDAGTYAPISTAEFVDIVSGASRYRFNGWTTTDMTEITSPASPSTTVLMDKAKTVTANYVTQYYLTVTSPYDSPTPTSGWFDAGTGITASVTSPWPGPAGTQYVCTGWAGTGSVPASGTTTTVTFTINAPSSITWNWKTQYYLTVKTDPAGIVTIPGEGWYDDSTNVTLTAPTVVNYNFINWDVDGVSRGLGVNPITVHMDGPHTATAHYQRKVVPVGGHIAPIDKSCLLAPTMGLAPWIGLALTFLVATAVMIILIRRRNKIL